MRVKLIFAWYDFWVGLFWDRKKKLLYIFPIPTIGIVINLERSKKKFICYEIWRPNIPDNGCVEQCKECKERQLKEQSNNQ